MAITSAFNSQTGELSIQIDGADDVTIAEVDLLLKVNGKDLAVGEVRSRDVESIEILATGDFANRIDLALVDVFSFVFLNHVTIDAGGGDDHIEAPGADSTLTGGEGDDTIGLAIVLEDTQVVITDSVKVLLGKAFLMEPQSRLCDRFWLCLRH